MILAPIHSRVYKATSPQLKKLAGSAEAHTEKMKSVELAATEGQKGVVRVGQVGIAIDASICQFLIHFIQNFELEK